ncbi:uncharacterized protein LOC131035113 [Cryptomeria japonica]|uniref:uncharacterized protein LOC131035113 n=1 Tax=Cryptomeria japonica TaxID=3369 RepID=UPI0025ABE10B|nr:uncharacterized protein LOC131035113 [Cryptomeria japonica]
MYFQASQDLSSFPCCNALFFNFRQILAYGSAEESMTDDKEFFILTSSSRQILTYGSAEESMTDDKEFFILTSSSRVFGLSICELKSFRLKPCVILDEGLNIWICRKRVKHGQQI